MNHENGCSESLRNFEGQTLGHPIIYQFMTLDCTLAKFIFFFVVKLVHKFSHQTFLPIKHLSKSN
jgi:hypothetical protein